MRTARRRVWREQFHEEATEKTLKDKVALNWEPTGAKLRGSGTTRGSSPSPKPGSDNTGAKRNEGRTTNNRMPGGFGPSPALCCCSSWWLTVQSPHWTDKEYSFVHDALNRLSCKNYSREIAVDLTQPQLGGTEGERLSAHRKEWGPNRGRFQRKEHAGAGTVLSTGGPQQAWTSLNKRAEEGGLERSTVNFSINSQKKENKTN